MGLTATALGQQVSLRSGPFCSRPDVIRRALEAAGPAPGATSSCSRFGANQTFVECPRMECFVPLPLSRAKLGCNGVLQAFVAVLTLTNVGGAGGPQVRDRLAP